VTANWCSSKSLLQVTFKMASTSSLLPIPLHEQPATGMLQPVGAPWELTSTVCSSRLPFRKEVCKYKLACVHTRTLVLLGASQVPLSHAAQPQLACTHAAASSRLGKQPGRSATNQPQLQFIWAQGKPSITAYKVCNVQWLSSICACRAATASIASHLSTADQPGCS
jgi:hypothetical protein